MVAASVRGTSHERGGLPCQDVHRWRILPDGTLLAAVADGAGSAACAEVGAACAAEYALNALHAELTRLPTDLHSEATEPVLRHLLTEALRAAQGALETEAGTRDIPLRDLATTLILVLATSQGAVALQVGDGAAIVGAGDGTLHSLTIPPAAEYANETIFLTSEEAMETAQFAAYAGPVAQVAVFSDGLQRLALRLPEGTPYPPFFNPLFRFVTEATDGALAYSQLVAFLSSPRIVARADDDLTLLLASLK